MNQIVLVIRIKGMCVQCTYMYKNTPPPHTMGLTKWSYQFSCVTLKRDPVLSMLATIFRVCFSLSFLSFPRMAISMFYNFNTLVEQNGAIFKK